MFITFLTFYQILYKDYKSIKKLINCYGTLELDKKISSLLHEVLKYLLNKKRRETTRFKKNCETTRFKKNCVLYIVVLRQSYSS